MNCKPGDTVIVVGNTTGVPCIEGARGHVFELVQGPEPHWFFGPLWRRAGTCPKCSAPERWYPDADLKPIPKDGLTDEEDDSAAIRNGEVAHA